VDVVAKVEAMALVPMQAHALNRVATALPAAPTLDSPRMAQAHRTMAHPARKVHVVTALSAVRATQPPLACRVMISSINRLRTTKKMISNPAPMHIWEPKVV
jgi:hypothetical protein